MSFPTIDLSRDRFSEGYFRNNTFAIQNGEPCATPNPAPGLAGRMSRQLMTTLGLPCVDPSLHGIFASKIGELSRKVTQLRDDLSVNNLQPPKPEVLQPLLAELEQQMGCLIHNAEVYVKDSGDKTLAEDLWQLNKLHLLVISISKKMSMVLFLEGEEFVAKTDMPYKRKKILLKFKEYFKDKFHQLQPATQTLLAAYRETPQEEGVKDRLKQLLDGIECFMEQVLRFEQLTGLALSKEELDLRELEYCRNEIAFTLKGRVTCYSHELKNSQTYEHFFKVCDGFFGQFTKNFFDEIRPGSLRHKFWHMHNDCNVFMKDKAAVIESEIAKGESKTLIELVDRILDFNRGEDSRPDIGKLGEVLDFILADNDKQRRDVFSQCLIHCINHYRLSFSDLGVSRILDFFEIAAPKLKNQLQYFDLGAKCPDGNTMARCARLLDQCPNIKHLGIHGEFVTDNVLSLISRRNFESLNLSYCFNITEEGLASLETLPLLRLSLAGNSVSGAMLERVGKMKQLEKLNLSYCTFNDDKDLSHLENLPLTHLNLRNTNFTDTNVFEGMKCFSQLKVLSLAYCVGLKKKLLHPFAGWVKLKSLDLSHCKGFEEHDKIILENSEYLKYLNLTGIETTKSDGKCPDELRRELRQSHRSRVCVDYSKEWTGEWGEKVTDMEI